jgi:hypothetical protein
MFVRRMLALGLLASCGSSPPKTVANTTSQASPIALSIVFCEQEAWVGNDDFETRSDMRFVGALHELERALDTLALPPGSTIAVFGYSSGAGTVVARRPLLGFHGTALGAQTIYKGKIATDLAKGVEAALAELTPVPATRKLLVIVGDGNDNHEQAVSQLADQAKRAAAAHVVIRAVTLRTTVSDPGDMVRTLVPDEKTAAMAAELEQLVAAAANAPP